ncbi:MAG: MBL fold metallo-hydrolase [Alphaproteobacteria bacterium]|nr:MBL fold metallo-hydrolase [Alphaproteobacteria bacterium]
MSRWTYRHGLHELGKGLYAYLQPDGSWGWSNAGLVRDGEEALLVDTLFDRHLTADMLAVMRDATGLSPRDIGTLVNTHANGDHTYGNGLLPEAEILASEAGAREMEEVPPEVLANMMRMAPELGAYFVHCFGRFDFEGLETRTPTKTFSGRLPVSVGDKRVELIEVGPAHTRGDVLVHVPSDRVIYTGDILFIDGTPIMWEGPVENWIAACDLILSLDLEAIVPGHGPITDKAGVARVRAYLVHVEAEARKRHEAGLDWKEAARDIALGDYESWLDSERIAVNVATLYRGFGAFDTAPPIGEVWGLMAELEQRARRRR